MHEFKVCFDNTRNPIDVKVHNAQPSEFNPVTGIGSPAGTFARIKISRNSLRYKFVHIEGRRAVFLPRQAVEQVGFEIVCESQNLEPMGVKLTNGPLEPFDVLNISPLPNPIGEMQNLRRLLRGKCVFYEKANDGPKTEARLAL